MGWIVGLVGMAASVAGGMSQKESIKEEGGIAYDEGLAAQREREWEAKQHDYFAVQVVAAAQRSAAEERRVARIKESRAVAVAAHGGGSVDDPTVIDIIGDIGAEGEYRALTHMYEGNQRAREHRIEAALKRYEGAMAKRGGQIALQQSKYSAHQSKFGMISTGASQGAAIASKYQERATSSRTGADWRGSRYGYN